MTGHTGDTGGEDTGDTGGEDTGELGGWDDESVHDIEERTESVWPVRLDGVVESVVTTLGPNGLWNVAMLGLHAPGGGVEARGVADGPVTATTWGRTRTWRNFEERGGGVVQFVTDPRDVVDAALAVREESEPVLDSADAWVRVAVERIAAGEEADTQWVRWALTPCEGMIRRRHPRTINRGFYAVVDATVAASRLDVDGYDTGSLLRRLEYFAETVERCGGPAEREAFERIDERTGWRARAERRDRERRNESF